jgi:hypothetical protein
MYACVIYILIYRVGTFEKYEILTSYLCACFLSLIRWDEWSQLKFVVEFMSNIPCKWNFINDCILLIMLYVFVVYIDTLKHINVMSWLAPKSHKSFSTPHFHWRISIQTIINVIGLVIISYDLSPLSSWRLTFYLQKVEYYDFLINYMYEVTHIAHTKIANLEGEFVDLNVLNK